MNEMAEKDIINIENKIYNIRGVEVMLDTELSAIKCHKYIFDKLVTHYDIGKTISVFI